MLMNSCDRGMRTRRGSAAATKVGETTPSATTAVAPSETVTPDPPSHALAAAAAVIQDRGAASDTATLQHVAELERNVAAAEERAAAAEERGAQRIATVEAEKGRLEAQVDAAIMAGKAKAAEHELEAHKASDAAKLLQARAVERARAEVKNEADVKFDELRVASELTVVEALARWAEHGAGGERAEAFASLFLDGEAVRLPWLQEAELAQQAARM